MLENAQKFIWKQSFINSLNCVIFEQKSVKKKKELGTELINILAFEEKTKLK